MIFGPAWQTARVTLPRLRKPTTDCRKPAPQNRYRPARTRSYRNKLDATLRQDRRNRRQGDSGAKGALKQRRHLHTVTNRLHLPDPRIRSSMRVHGGQARRQSSKEFQHKAGMDQQKYPQIDTLLGF
ncbi:Hypothetical predicted protein [Pelobates cultripes]|uniref:Uncharacterized protein n=1 Tax=Pelobates cultripes TaxID=61616 RepID=A0AAD1SXV8_PELCU|nr:Hypothetical predicted protein [Pelobates cultripes]